MRRFIHICMAVLIIGAVCFFIKNYISGGRGTEYREAISRDEERVDLDFTVCEAGRLPNELLEIIEEKKAAPFKLTFTTREYMYIVVGYGAQQRGGCSVTVNSLYRTSQAVYIDTNLIGVEGETIQIDGMTYPYIAVKCENQNLPVVYE